MTDRPLSPLGQRLAEARAFDAFVQRHRAPLTRYFRRRGMTPDEAEDLTQDVFLKLMRKLKEGKEEIADGYVFAAASSVLIDHRRRVAARGGNHGTLVLDENIAWDAPGADRIVEDREALRVIRREIINLPAKLARAFILYRFDQVPQTEIARRMNVSTSSVEKYIVAAVERLRQSMADRDG